MSSLQEVTVPSSPDFPPLGVSLSIQTLHCFTPVTWCFSQRKWKPGRTNHFTQDVLHHDSWKHRLLTLLLKKWTLKSGTDIEVESNERTREVASHREMSRSQIYELICLSDVILGGKQNGFILSALKKRLLDWIGDLYLMKLQLILLCLCYLWQGQSWSF